MYTKKQRTFASLICVLMMIVALFFLSYIIQESDHDCTGENCPVCACIHNAEQNLKQLGTGLVSSVALIPVMYFAILALLYVFHELHDETLIVLKVRLNN